MNKMEIKKQAYARMTKIEEIYCDHVPKEAQQYWRLNLLISEGLPNYIATNGLCPLSTTDCYTCRQELGLGSLSQFEKDCIAYLNHHIQQGESRYENHNLKVLEA